MQSILETKTNGLLQNAFMSVCRAGESKQSRDHGYSSIQSQERTGCVIMENAIALLEMIKDKRLISSEWSCFSEQIGKSRQKWEMPDCH